MSPVDARRAEDLVVWRARMDLGRRMLEVAGVVDGFCEVLQNTIAAGNSRAADVIYRGFMRRLGVRESGLPPGARRSWRRGTWA